MFEISNMNDHHSRTSSETTGSNYGSLDLDKMNPLGELSFFFGDRPSNDVQQQRQQQPAKRSMDDVLKKLTSKMHISHSPVDETDQFNTKDRSVFSFL